MSNDEVSKRRQLLLRLSKNQPVEQSKTQQPLLLRHDWRVGCVDADTFHFM